MDEEVDRLDQYTEDLRADRRPPKQVLPNEQSLRARRAAALLFGIRMGADVATHLFLTRIEGQIAKRIQEGTESRRSRI